jgi:hypothetical protein
MRWNRGIQTNDNYMFRRWLCKLSTVFDWQERRLQSLSLVLEAATGTKATDQFMVLKNNKKKNKKKIVRWQRKMMMVLDQSWKQGMQNLKIL